MDYRSFDFSPTFGLSAPLAMFHIGESKRKLGKNVSEETEDLAGKRSSFPFETFRGGWGGGGESGSFCYPRKLAELKCLWCLNDSEGLFCKRCNGIKIWGLPGEMKSGRSMLYFLDIAEP